MILLRPVVGWAFIIALLISCAQVRGVSGGEKDTQPPLVQKTSPDNYSTQFTSKTITLEFDEFVQTGSLLQNLIVSPPLKKNPKISIRGKSVTLTLQEELKPNTTYVFQFGEGISDVRENNLLGDYSYVVSTGDFLDSLKVSGNVKDVWDGLPLKGMKAMLFDSEIPLDSAGVKPLYYSKSDAEGNFMIPFLKDGEYRLEVLEDLNNNMLFDEGEKVAFLTETVRPVNPKEEKQLTLSASVPKKKLTFISDLRVDSSGFFAFTWPQWCDLPDVKIEEEGLSITQYRDPMSDTVFHWIDGIAPDKSLYVVVESTDMGIEADSLEVLYYKNTSHGFKDLHPVSAKIHTHEAFVLFSRYRIYDVYTDNIDFWNDSLPWDPEINLRPESNEIEIIHDWKEGGKYSVVFSGSSISARDNSISDSLFFAIPIVKSSESGSLSVSFTQEDGVSNVFMLTDAAGQIVFKKDIAEIEDPKINFLKPGEYTARIFEDTNGNLMWDSVDYQQKTPAEPLFVHPQKIQIRANWEVVLDW